jgi:hypothetical protein
MAGMDKEDVERAALRAVRRMFELGFVQKSE